MVQNTFFLEIQIIKLIALIFLSVLVEMYKQTEMLRLSRDKSIRGVNAGRSLAHTTMFYDNLVNMHSTRTNQLTGILFVNRIKTVSLKISEKKKWLYN